MKQHRKIFQELNIQMMIFFITATLIFSMIMSAFYYQRTFRMLRDNSEQYHIQSMQQSQRWISQTLEEVDRLSKILVYDNIGQSILADTEQVYNGDTAIMYNEFLKRIHNVLITYPFIHSIYFYTRDGLQIGANQLHTCVDWDSPSSLYIPTLIQNSWMNWNIVGGLQEDFFNPLFNAAEENPNLITMVKQEVVMQSNFVWGYIVVNIQEKAFYNYVHTSRANEELFVVNTDRQIVSGRDKSKIGKIYENQDHLDLKKPYSSVMSDTDGVPNLNLSYRIPGTTLWLVNNVQLDDLEASSREMIVNIIFTMTIGSLLLLLIISIWLRKKLSPLRELTAKMGEIQYGKFGATLKKIPQNELGILVRKFNEMSLAITSLMEKNEQIHQEKVEQELMVLQAQLNPHFIYNTLNMVKWMAVMRGANNIAECITTLGCLLEPIFRSKGSFWSMQSEIDYLQNYIKIMGWRYGNMCTFECLIPDECRGMLVPRYIFQPIVENSVTHGVPKEKAIHIVISCEKKEKQLLLYVSDNGNSIPPEKLEELRRMLQNDTVRPNSSVGLFNVNRRIKLNFGEEYGIKIESKQNCGTTVQMTLPIILSGTQIPENSRDQ